MSSGPLGRVLNAALGAAFVFGAGAGAAMGQTAAQQGMSIDGRAAGRIAITELCLASGGSTPKLIQLVTTKVPTFGGVHIDNDRKGTGSFWFGPDNSSGFGLFFRARLEKADEVEHCQAILYTEEAVAVADSLFEMLSVRDVEPLADPFTGKKIVGRIGRLTTDGLAWRVNVAWTEAADGLPDMMTFTVSPQR